jgi:maltodextrin utilization protein YvdJ
MLKSKILFVVMIFLAGTLALPVGVSHATSSNFTAGSPSFQTTSGQPLTNHTMTNSSSSSHAMMKTAVTPDANDTKAAQQISDFVHQAIADFKQQGIETKQAISDCRDKLQSATPEHVSGVRNNYCTTNLSTIKVKYQDERVHFTDLIKKYRSSVMVMINDARGLSVSKTTLDGAFAQLGMMIHSSMSSGMMGKTTLNNTG